jgi:hypothetical protein
MHIKNCVHCVWAKIPIVESGRFFSFIYIEKHFSIIVYYKIISIIVLFSLCKKIFVDCTVLTYTYCTFLHNTRVLV